MKKNVFFKVLLAIVLILSVTITLFSPSTEAAKKVSYLMNTKKIYTYAFDDYQSKYSSDSSENSFTFDKKIKDYYYWLNSSYKYTYKYKENKQGLYFNVGDYDDPLLKYPVKKNKTWTDKNSPGSIWKITSTNTEVKVKAGTFKNVVLVKTQYSNPWKGYDINYYAPNVGWILYKSYNSKKTGNKTMDIKVELIELKNK